MITPPSCHLLATSSWSPPCAASTFQTSVDSSSTLSQPPAQLWHLLIHLDSCKILLIGVCLRAILHTIQRSSSYNPNKIVSLLSWIPVCGTQLPTLQNLSFLAWCLAIPSLISYHSLVLHIMVWQSQFTVFLHHVMMAHHSRCWHMLFPQSSMPTWQTPIYPLKSTPAYLPNSYLAFEIQFRHHLPVKLFLTSQTSSYSTLCITSKHYAFFCFMLLK